jgi:hypothetical protein
MATNCPMYPDYYDPTMPVWHDKPVHHSGIQARLQDYPAGCLWAQLQWEREQDEREGGVSGEYLTNWRPSGAAATCVRDACGTLTIR